jgi:hypothetical protein
MDDISFTLWESDGSLLFSSNWSMGKTQQQRLDRGNVQVNQPRSNTGKTANTLELTSDAVDNTSTEGQAVTFTAEILEDDSAVPTGTITFLSGNTVLGYAPVSNNKVVFRTSMLDIGEHRIWAYYSGDSRFAASDTEGSLLNHRVLGRSDEPIDEQPGDTPSDDTPDTEEPVKEDPISEEPVKEEPIKSPKGGKGKNAARTVETGGENAEGSEESSEVGNLKEELALGMFNMGELKLSAYPNPSKGMFELSLSGYEEGGVSVTVLNVAGTLVRNLEYEYGNGLTRVFIDITDHAPGIYFCYVKQGRIAQMIRLVKNQ